MKHMAEASRVHLNCHREGVVVCPYCGHEKMLNMAHYRHYIGGKSLKGRCKRCCGSFLVTFDYRQHVRIPVDFAGQLVHSARQKSSENILITSLSVAGVGF
ncbi:MAG: hypothetical protein FJZ47_01795, partial [Candidatus Tectomicrobia bacterium]|nr:hypothetical protein [Candidatus Tectomicrobia bacterium]